MTHALLSRTGGQAALFAPDETQAYRTLVGIAGRHLRPLPPGFLARHVLRLYGADGWPLQRAAFEVTLRYRAQASSLEVCARPETALGVYTLRDRSGPSPWRPHLGSLEPLDACCDCPAFLKNGLGLCAHVVAVLLDLAGENTEAGAWERACAAAPLRHALEWDPVRPIVGDAPWWARLRFRGAGRGPRFVRAWVRDADGTRAPSADRPADWLPLARRFVERHPGRVSPSAAALIERLTPRASDPPLDLDAALASLHRPLYDYQRESLTRLLDTGRLLLADDMGLGKTAQAIAACHVLRRSGRVRRGLLIVPAPLKSQWQREWLSFSDAPVTVVSGPPPARRALYDATDEGFLIVNFELLRRDAASLREWAPDLVVIDEAQRIKNAATLTARTVKTFAPRYRLALTGTPLENRLPELGSIMEWVDERALAPTWRIPVVHGGVGCATRLQSLRSRIAHCFLRRRRAEILDQLPARTDTTVPVEMTRRQLVLHRALDSRVARLINEAKKRRLKPEEQLLLMSLLTRQRVIANGVAQKEFEERWVRLKDLAPTKEALASTDSPKLEALRELVRSLVIDQGRTIVVFSQWRRMLKLAWWATQAQLEPEGLRSVFFTGAESLKARDRSVVELHDDPQTRVLFSSDAGGVGLNLQRAATACVNLELPWNPAVLEQRVARIHRLGQTRPIDVYNLVAHDSIEGRIAGLVDAKRALFDGLFDTDEDHVIVDDATLVQRLSALWEPVAEEPLEDGFAALPAEAPTPAPPAPEPSGPRVQQLFERVRVTAREDGGLVIDAPPDAAEDLAALFRGMAATLKRAG